MHMVDVKCDRCGKVIASVDAEDSYRMPAIYCLPCGLDEEWDH
jgi:hypothetical protein